MDTTKTKDLYTCIYCVITMKTRQKRIIDAKVWKSGNSYVVTLPQPLVEKFNLKAGDLIELEVSKEV